jgi:4'-phosphopantetheinyl transferase
MNRPPPTTPGWLEPPPTMPSLDPGKVHLWRIKHDREPATLHRLDSLRRLLSQEELAKADRFRAEHARSASIHARAMTRTILALYLNEDARSLQFRFNNYGKPLLAEPSPTGSVQFNVSHSGDWVVLAVADGAAVGVDIERHRRLEDAMRLAERFFSTVERTALAALPPIEQLPAFFRCWSRKEAYIKAVGTGIFAGLDNFDVTLAPDEPPRVTRFHTADYQPAEWTLAEFHLEDGYSAATLANFPSIELRQFEWRPDDGE